MLSRPDALDLVTLAREAVLAQLLPHLEGDARYQGLMAANALAIALRELQRGDDDGEARQLRELYGDTIEPGVSLAQMNARLASDIRRGEFDGAVELGLRGLLRQQVRARLEVSNPRYRGRGPD